MANWLGAALAAFSEGMCPECSASLNREGYCHPCLIRWSADFERGIIISHYPVVDGDPLLSWQFNQLGVVRD